MMEKAQKGEKIEATAETSYTFEEILDLKFKMLLNSDYFKKNKNGIWEDKTDDELFINSQLENATEIKVVGIIKPIENSVSNQTSGFVGFKKELMETLITRVNESEIVKAQKKDKDINVFTGTPFENNLDNMDYQGLMQYISSLPYGRRHYTLPQKSWFRYPPLLCRASSRLQVLQAV